MFMEINGMPETLEEAGILREAAAAVWGVIGRHGGRPVGGAYRSFEALRSGNGPYSTGQVRDVYAFNVHADGASIPLPRVIEVPEGADGDE